jgi:hypothetical protein
MTDIDRRQWLALLKAERDRRAARVEWRANEGERAREQLLDTLQQMAQRMAATAHLFPLDVSDMAPAEMLACHLMPEHLRPAGLPTEDQILAEYRARTAG